MKTEREKQVNDIKRERRRGGRLMGRIMGTEVHRASNVVFLHSNGVGRKQEEY